MDRLEQMIDAISVIRCSAVSGEMELHQQVIDALRAAGFDPQHEVRLGPRCRIDVMCGDVGVEIKKSRPQPAPLRRQLERYAAFDAIAEMLVIAPRGVNLPAKIGGKRVRMLALERLWGIWLP